MKPKPKENKFLRSYLNLNEIHDVDCERASQISQNMVFLPGIFDKSQLKPVKINLSQEKLFELQQISDPSHHNFEFDFRNCEFSKCIP